MAEAYIPQLVIGTNVAGVYTPEAVAAGTYLGPVQVVGSKGLVVFANVTVPGTSTTISVEYSPDGGTTWYTPQTADTMTAITTLSTKCKSFTPLAKHARVRVVTVGAVTLSVLVQGVAHV